MKKFAILSAIIVLSLNIFSQVKLVTDHPYLENHISIKLNNCNRDSSISAEFNIFKHNVKQRIYGVRGRMYKHATIYPVKLQLLYKDCTIDVNSPIVLSIVDSNNKSHSYTINNSNFTNLNRLVSKLELSNNKKIVITANSKIFEFEAVESISKEMLEKI